MFFSEIKHKLLNSSSILSIHPIEHFFVGCGRGNRISSSSSNTTTDGGEEVNGIAGTEDESLDKTPQGVLVIPFGPTMGECVGLLSEQKILKVRNAQIYRLLIHNITKKKY